jgi:hypothetical protein
MPDTCRAVRVNDQMICPCGRQWDISDPEPPECVTLTPGRATKRRAAYLEFIERLFGIEGVKK